MPWPGIREAVARIFRPAEPSDPLNVLLVQAYESASFLEREKLIGKLRDDALGIQRVPLSVFTRWHPKDRDLILAECESGQFWRLGHFLDAMRSEGLISGLMRVRTAGLLKRPTIFTGDPDLCARLRGVDPTYDDSGTVVDPGRPGVFRSMVPTAEFAKILRDYILAGIGLGERVARKKGEWRRLRHLPLHWLRYDYGSDRWLYAAPGGTYEIKPGDGRWFLMTRGERPWIDGSWFPLAWPFISRAGTDLDRLRWQTQLADPLKVVELGNATERDRRGMLGWIRDKWHRAASLVLRKDEKAYLVESNGRGYQVYLDSEASAEKKIQFELSGQMVTGEGNKGFSEGDIFEAIHGTVIQETADEGAEALTDMVLGPWAEDIYHAPRGSVRMNWDVRSPSQRNAEAEAHSTALDVVQKADERLSSRGQQVDLPAYLKLQGLTLPVRPSGGELAASPTDDRINVRMLQ